MKRRLDLLLVGLSVTALSITVTAQVDGRWGARLAEGFRSLSAGNLPVAAAIFEEVAVAARTAHDDESYAEARRGQGRVLGARGDAAGMQAAYAEALALFEAAGDQRSIGRVRMDLGFAAWQRSDVNGVKAEYELAAAAFERAGLRSDQASALRNITFSNIPRPERLAILDRALAMAREGTDRTLEALILHSIGDAMSGAGDQQAALERYEAALPLLEASADKAALARLLTSFGRLFRLHGDPAHALPYYERTLELLAPTPDRDAIRQAEDALSISLAGLGRDREALTHAERALTIAEVSRPAMVPQQRLRVGEMALNAGDLDRALALFTPAQERVDLIVDQLILRSVARLRRGDTDAALADAEAAVAALPNQTWEAKVAAYDARGDVYERVGRLPEAIADAITNVNVIESLRGGLVISDDFRVSFSEGYRHFFDRAAELLARSGRQQEAFEMAERGRARALLDLRQARAPIDTLTSPAALDVAGRTASSALPAGDTLISYWVTRNATFAWVVNAGGVVHSAKIAIGRKELDSLVAKANAAKRRPATETSLAMRGQAQTVFENDPRPTLKLLHDRIFTPIRSALPKRPGARLIIIPDGPLLGLSFAELVAPSGRYVVEDYTLQYAPSMALLKRTSPPTTVKSGDLAALLVSVSGGYPKMLGETLAPLPGARREVDALATLFPGRTTTRVSDSDATEQRVRDAMAQPGVIHLATHAVASSRQPSESFLAFRPGGGQDGRLTAGEIIEMNLRAELVVLSACHGASGQVAGEGMLGLSRALLAAGAHSLLASVRELPDDAAADILPRFYAAWKISGDAAAALRSAQLDQLRRLRAGRVHIATPFGDVTVPEHPSMWAGLVLIGER